MVSSRATQNLTAELAALFTPPLSCPTLSVESDAELRAAEVSPLSKGTGRLAPFVTLEDDAGGVEQEIRSRRRLNG